MLSLFEPVRDESPRGLIGKTLIYAPLWIPYARWLPLCRAQSAKARIVPAPSDEDDHVTSNVFVDAAELRRAAADSPPRPIHISYDLE